MGYTTYFDGDLDITPPLEENQIRYLQKFSETRRIKRDAGLASDREDKLREAVGLPIGLDAGYFVGASGEYGQENTFAAPDVISYNCAPGEQPGLWCQWWASNCGKFLSWDEGEKFGEYEEWLNYMIDHFFKPWGRTLNGQIRFSGEEDEDRGVIYVKDNMVELVYDEITNRGPSWACVFCWERKLTASGKVDKWERK